MYKIIKSFFVFLTAFCCWACTDKAPEYPDLEGYWKQERIDDGNTGTQTVHERVYWAFQLGVSEVRNIQTGEDFLCRYEYNEGASSLRMYDFRMKGNKSQKVNVGKLSLLGIPSDDVIYEVVKLDGDRMLLRADDITLHFRKF